MIINNRRVLIFCCLVSSMVLASCGAFLSASGCSSELQELTQCEGLGEKEPGDGKNPGEEEGGN